MKLINWISFVFIFFIYNKGVFSTNATNAEYEIYWAPVDTLYLIILITLCLGFSYLQCLYCFVTWRNRYGFGYLTLT